MAANLRLVTRSQAIVLIVWLAAICCSLLIVPYDCAITTVRIGRAYDLGRTVHYRFILSDPPANAPVPLLDEKQWGKSQQATEAPMGISLARLALESSAVTLACSAAFLYVTFVRNSRSAPLSKPPHWGAASNADAAANFQHSYKNNGPQLDC